MFAWLSLLFSVLLLSAAASSSSRRNQLYTREGFRRVAGVVPYKWVDGEPLFFLVGAGSKKATGRNYGWILPKGGMESGETPEVTAKREAAEEIGVLGNIGAQILGHYGQVGQEELIDKRDGGDKSVRSVPASSYN